MKTLFFVMIALMCFHSTAHAERVSFLLPDAEAHAIVEKIFLEQNIPAQTPIRARIAWLNLEDDQPSYLFARLNVDCGQNGCPIYGFRQGETGQWVKIYGPQFGKKGFEVLETKTEGHYDLRQWNAMDSIGYEKKISRWSDGKYGEPEIEVRSYKELRKKKVATCDELTMPRCRENDPTGEDGVVPARDPLQKPPVEAAPSIAPTTP